MERVKRWICTLLAVCVMLTLLPVTAWGAAKEEFSLKVGETYYFLVDIETRRAYVPFTYAGTINAYVLNENAERVAEATDDAAFTTNPEAKYGYTYDHSLFVAERNVLWDVTWGNLTGVKENLIYGKDYPYNGIRYTLRAMTGGSTPLKEGDNTYGLPGNNEWEVLRSKGCIKYPEIGDTWVQDTDASDKMKQCRRGGGGKLESWDSSKTLFEYRSNYRPVLEITDVGDPGPNTKREDALKVVNIDLNGGKLYSGEKSFNIIVKNNTMDFTAPSTAALNRPDGSWRDGYLMWVDEYGEKYRPGETVGRKVTKLTALWSYEGPEEQFDLTTGETYYFDLSGMAFTGTKNNALPDTSMHYVPFTYAGTVNGYVLNSNSAKVVKAAEEAAATTDPNGTYGYTYEHSLFMANYAFTTNVSWKTVNQKKPWMLFGRDITRSGVEYRLRAPSAGSLIEATGLYPQTNEWDAIVNKNDGFIPNWEKQTVLGQDTNRKGKTYWTLRGGAAIRRAIARNSSNRNDVYRPVLEILNDGTMTRDALRVVTLDLNDARLSGQRYLKMVAGKDNAFTAPSFAGITLPEGYNAKDARWRDDNGTLYSPGDSVPADVSSLRLRWIGGGESQLTEGETYWFDLSAAGFDGEKYGKLPDPTLHYVPFIYIGSLNAYAFDGSVITNSDEEVEEYAKNHPYDHSLFLADYPLGKTSWNALKDMQLIYGKSLAVNGVTYKLRAPSAFQTSGGDLRGSEWDEVLAKGEDYIKNWERGQGTWGQDSLSNDKASCRGEGRMIQSVSRTVKSLNKYYRPVLQVTNTFAIGPTVTLELNGSKLGDAEQLSIIVKEDDRYTAPTAEGLPRPEGIEGDYFRWKGSDGQLYTPGDSVSTAVLTLTAQWTESAEHSHTYGEWTSNGDGTHTRTCTVEGCGHAESGSCTGGTATCQAEAVCAVCGGAYGEKAPDHHGDKLKWVITETEHRQACEACGKATVESAAHVYEDEEDTVCGVCGYERTLAPVGPHEHVYGEWIPRDSETHTRACTVERCEQEESAAHVYADEKDTVCDDCGYERQLPAEPHEHVYDEEKWVSNGDGTHSHACTVKGCTEVSQTERCVGTVIPAVPATCTAAGLTEGQKCSLCGAVLTAQREIPKLSHTEDKPVKEKEVPATCTAAGSYDEVVYCVNCHTELHRNKMTVKALEHDWGGWTVITQPTASAAGERVRTCQTCQTRQTEEIPATGGGTGGETGGDVPAPAHRPASGTGGSAGRSTAGSTGSGTEQTVRSAGTGDSGVTLYALAAIAALGGAALLRSRRRRARV